MTEQTARRGPYRKGAERRQRIIDTAVEIFGTQGFRSGSVREIAKRVGLTPAGLNHHFGSKEELLAETVRERDDIIRAQVAEHEAPPFPRDVSEVVGYNQEHRGLTSLFTVLVAEATDPEHPAHQYFSERYEKQVRAAAETIAARIGTHDVAPGIDPEVVSSLITAAMDGLQLQMLLRPDFEMQPAIDQLLDILFPGWREESAPTRDRGDEGAEAAVPVPLGLGEPVAVEV